MKGNILPFLPPQDPRPFHLNREKHNKLQLAMSQDSPTNFLSSNSHQHPIMRETVIRSHGFCSSRRTLETIALKQTHKHVPSALLQTGARSLHINRHVTEQYNLYEQDQNAFRIRAGDFDSRSNFLCEIRNLMNENKYANKLSKIMQPRILIQDQSTQRTPRIPIKIIGKDSSRIDSSVIDSQRIDSCVSETITPIVKKNMKKYQNEAYLDEVAYQINDIQQFEKNLKISDSSNWAYRF